MLRVVEVGVRRPFAGSHRATLRRNRATVAVRGEACALGLFAFHLCECRLKQTLGLPELAVRPVRICHVSNAFSVDCFVYMPAIPVFYCCWAMNFAYSPADSRSGSSSSSSILIDPPLAVRVVVDDRTVVLGLAVHVAHHAGHRRDHRLDGLADSICTSSSPASTRMPTSAGRRTRCRPSCSPRIR